MAAERPVSVRKQYADGLPAPRPRAACKACHTRHIRCDMSGPGNRCSNCWLSNKPCIERSSLKRGRKKDISRRCPPDKIQALDRHLAGFEASDHRLPVPATLATAWPSLPNYISAPSEHLSAEDVDSLHRAGAFCIPKAVHRYELLRCYVQYVHPMLPILDLRTFMNATTNTGGVGTISLFLFQAVMFAGSSYISQRTVSSLGHISRISLCKSFFQKLKSLFDVGYERDRVVTVQSLLLMTYWYESPDAIKDCWYWLHNAITIARTIGLDRNTNTSTLDNEQRRLWKRIWWSCYCRDRILALEMRRPLQIRDADFKLPPLEAADFEMEALPQEIRHILRAPTSPMADAELHEAWAELFMAVSRLCQIITPVFQELYEIRSTKFGSTQGATMRYVPRESSVDHGTVQKLASELEGWLRSLPDELQFIRCQSDDTADPSHADHPMDVHRAVLWGVYLVLVGNMYRPQALPATLDRPTAPNVRDASRKRVHEKAISTTAMFRSLKRQGLLRFLPNTGVAIIFPAAMYNILGLRSHDTETRKRCGREYKFCMQVLRQMQDIHPSVESVCQILEAAFHRTSFPGSQLEIEGQAAAEHPRSSREPDPGLCDENTDDQSLETSQVATPNFPEIAQEVLTAITATPGEMEWLSRMTQNACVHDEHEATVTNCVLGDPAEEPDTNTQILPSTEIGKELQMLQPGTSVPLSLEDSPQSMNIEFLDDVEAFLDGDILDLFFD